MATDTQAMGLLIRMMPLMLREFAMRVDPAAFFNDAGYASAVLEAAGSAQEPRLANYAAQLRARLAEIGKGPPGAVRSAPMAVDTAPTVPSNSQPVAAPPGPQARSPSAADSPKPAKKYTRSLR